MDPETFEKIVAEALDSVPEEFQHYLENVEVVIEPVASQEQLDAVGLRPPHTLMGLYHGVPLTERGSYRPATPDRITIYREPILRHCSGPDAVRSQVRRTVLHEIAHFFGITDQRLHDLDAY